MRTTASTRATRSEAALRASLVRLRALDPGQGIDPTAVLDSVAHELHELRGTLAAAYRPARVANDWLIGAAGPRAELIVTDLAPTATPATDWFRYDPLRPAADQRNTVVVAERDAAPAIVGPFFDRLGKQIGQTRTLVCDGPVLLAWIGILRHPDQRRGDDREIVRRVGAAVRRRLRLALRIPASLGRHAFEAALDAYPGEAYVVRGDGRIQFANALAAQRLVGGLCARTRELAEVAARYPAAPDGFEVHPLRSGTAAGRHFLVIRRDAPDLAARIVERARAWKLSARQTEVLRCLAMGDANKEIATRLGGSLRTIEQHVAAILERAKVDTRLRLVARIWRG
jgi:DNA-binding CsgD family transcriptional regulator